MHAPAHGSRRLWITGVAVVAAVVGAGVYWFGPQHLVLDRRVDEALPAVVDAGTDSGSDGGSDGSTTLSTGAFRSLAHETGGTASIVELDDGTLFVRIEDLDTLSGPDLRVYLSEAPADGPGEALDRAFVDLGGLKGNQGNQNYEIPADVDIDDFGSVSIWCRRFSVGFGVAPLSPPR